MTTRVMWFVVGFFLLAAAVVAYVLYSTQKTLAKAQATAATADTVIGDVNTLGMGLKKAWTDVGGLFSQENN